MSANVAQINANTDTFGTLLARLSMITSVLNTNVVTTSATANGSVTSGNSHIDGVLSGLTIAAGSLRGGNTQSPAPLVITTNTQVGNLSGSYLTATDLVGVGSNVALTTAALSVGNSTVNAQVQSSGLMIGGVSVVNSTSVNVGSNVSVSTAGVVVGNTTVNSSLLAASLQIGGVPVVNSTVHAVGSNVALTTAGLGVGNSTVNSSLQSTGLFIGGVNVVNSTVTSVGNSTVNSSLQSGGLFIGSVPVVNSTAVSVGANVLLTVAAARVGNSTVNSSLQQSGLFIGAVNVVNSTSVNVGANVSLSTSGVSIGNSTVNVVVSSNSLIFNGQVAVNSSGINASSLSSGVVPDARMAGQYTGMGIKRTSANPIILSSNLTSNTEKHVAALATFRSSAPTVNGAIVFLSPSVNSSIMHHLAVRGYNYTNNGTGIVDFSASGYRSANSTGGGIWTMMDLFQKGSMRVPVRWGRKATFASDGSLLGQQNALIVGDANTVWSYPHLVIDSALLSHVGATDTYCTGWSSEIVAALTAPVNGGAAGYDQVSVSLTDTGITTKLDTASTTAFTRTLLDDSDADTFRSTLGLGTAATTNSAAYSPNNHTHSFADIAAKPTTLNGYGITDAQPLDADLSAIAALVTQPVGRSLLTAAAASDIRGIASVPVSNASSTNLNAVVEGGLYSFESTAGGAPPASSGSLLLLHQNGANSAANTARQVAFQVANNAHWHRAKNAGTWTAWNRAWTAEDLLGTVAQSAGVPTGAVIERGTNANGGYTRFADGTQICTLNITVQDVAVNTAYNTGLFTGSRNWTFPVAFAAAPTVSVGQFRWSTEASWGTVSLVSNTSATMRVIDNVSRASGVDVTISASAIGRWF